VLRKKQSPKLPEDTGPLEYPSGICVKAGSLYWYIKGEYKWKFGSKRAMESWGFKYIAHAQPSNLSRYRHMGSLGFRDGTLLYYLKDAKLYIISDSEKRPVTSADALERLGLKLNDAVVVGEDELKIHNNGEDYS
jgi:hypothetical protein